MPAGSGIQLPAGAKLTVEIGYRGATWKKRRARASWACTFAEKAPAQTPASIEITPAPLSVAPGKNRRALPRRDGDQERDDDCGDVAAARTRRAFD